MKSIFVSIALALVIAFAAGATPLFAKTLEQRVFYQFDPNPANPKAVGEEGIKQVIYKGLVLWVAQPRPNRPTIVYFHGSGGNLGDRRFKFRWMMRRGYGVVAMAYPGSSGSKGSPSHSSIQSLATSLYKDLPKFVGDSPIVLMGESLGTGVAIELAASPVVRNNPPVGIVLHSPYTSLIDLVAYKRPLMLPLFATRTDLWPSKKLITRIKTPLFILHGKKDTTVPFKMGQTLYRLSPSKNKKLVTLPNAGHGEIWDLQLLIKLHAWLREL